MAGVRRLTMIIVSIGAAAPVAAADDGHRLQSGEGWRSAPIDAPGVNGAVVLAGEVDDATVGPASVRDAYRGIETRADARVRNLRIRNFTGQDLQRDGIRLRNVAGATIENFRLEMRDQPQQQSNLPEGITILSGQDIQIRNGSVRGFRMMPVKDRYTNGDGIATERAVSAVVIQDVTSSDNGDAGFDLKSADTRLDRLIASNNARNFRFWGQVDAGTLTSIDPRAAHIWLGKGAVVRIKLLRARSKDRAPLILLDGAQSLQIDRCDLRLMPGTDIIQGERGGVTIRIGPGCGGAAVADAGR